MILVVIPGQICESPMAATAMIAAVRITYTTSLIGISIEALSSLKKDGMFFGSNTIQVYKLFHENFRYILMKKADINLENYK